MEQSVNENDPKTGKPHVGNPVLTQTDLAWLAGIMDGEGCITLSRSFAKTGFDSAKTLIDISMCSRPAINKVAEIVYLITHKKYPIKENNYRGPQRKSQHTSYKFRVMDQKGCRKVCEALMPYLVVKKETAEIMIQFCESRQSHKNGRQGSKYTEYEKSLIQQCREALKAAYTTKIPSLGSVETVGDHPFVAEG